MVASNAQKVSTARTLIKIDKNGTKYFQVDACPRCNGTGKYEMTTIDSFRCWKCGATGYFPHIEKEYTPEYAEVLAQKGKERHLKKQKERLPQEIKRRGFDDENSSIFVVAGDTYPIREKLKKAGAKYDSWYGWYFKDAISAKEWDTNEVKFSDIFTINDYFCVCAKEGAGDILAQAKLKNLKTGGQYGRN